MKEADEAFGKDPEAIYHYTMMVSILMLSISLSVLFSYLILEFAIPLFLGNGQTFCHSLILVDDQMDGGIAIRKLCFTMRSVRYSIWTKSRGWKCLPICVSMAR